MTNGPHPERHPRGQGSGGPLPPPFNWRQQEKYSPIRGHSRPGPVSSEPARQASRGTAITLQPQLRVRRTPQAHRLPRNRLLLIEITGPDVSREKLIRCPIRPPPPRLRQSLSNQGSPWCRQGMAVDHSSRVIYSRHTEDTQIHPKLSGGLFVTSSSGGLSCRQAKERACRCSRPTPCLPSSRQPNPAHAVGTNSHGSERRTNVHCLDSPSARHAQGEAGASCIHGDHGVPPSLPPPHPPHYLHKNQLEYPLHLGFPSSGGAARLIWPSSQRDCRGDP